MDISTVSAALGGIKTAYELAISALTTRDDAKLADAQKLFSDEILKVNLAALQLAEKNAAAIEQIQSLKESLRQCKTEIANLEERKAERAKYELHELSKGTFVFAYKKTSDDGVPMHYLCQGCMDNRSQKFVLQFKSTSRGAAAVCPECKNEYITGVRYDPYTGDLYKTQAFIAR